MWRVDVCGCVLMCVDVCECVLMCVDVCGCGLHGLLEREEILACWCVDVC